MALLLRLAAWADRLSLAAAWFGRWLVLVCCVVSAGNAALRYAFNIGSNAWLEVQWYMFAGIVMLGGAYTLKANEHIRIDLLYGRLSPRGRAWLDVLGTLFLFLPVVVLLTWLSWRFFTQSWLSGEASNNVGGLPLWPAKMLLPIGFGLLLLQGLGEMVKRFGFLLSVQNLDLHYEKPMQ